MNNKEIEIPTKKLEEMTDEDFENIILEFTKDYLKSAQNVSIESDLKEDFHLTEPQIESFIYFLGDCLENGFDSQYHKKVMENTTLKNIAKETKKYLLEDSLKYSNF
jgi:hypothetical protein